MNEFFNRRGKWRWLRMRAWLIEGWLIQRIGLIKEWSLKREGRISCIIVIVVILGTLDAYTGMYIVGKERSITLHYLVGFLLTVATIYLFLRRTKNQEKQTDNQAKQIDREIEKEVEDRFTTAVNSLGSDQTSVRTVAIYSLYQHAVDYEKHRKRIVEILCSHIRSTTREPAYQKQYKQRPSDEIQTTIDLLFRETENIGLYYQFRKELPNANLSYAYCVGADFRKAHCQGVDFERANCWGADFSEAHCQGANFVEAGCQGTNFKESYCQGANFRGSSCVGADFLEADCRGADFFVTHCQGTYFPVTYCQGANFGGALCQGAAFWQTRCQGAHSSDLLQALESRIDKYTELTLVLEGALSQQSIDAIEKAKEYCSPNWYTEMQKIIEANKGKEEKRGIPQGIISGVLEDSEELRKLIKELKDIRDSNII